jgi:hypothetical protein
MTLVLGSSFYDADPDTMRRQARAMDALRDLPDAVAVDLQWTSSPPRRPWIRTVPALRRDSTTVTGRAGRVKPIASEAFDALADVAAAEGARYFVYFNSDIIVSPAAVAIVTAGQRTGYAFSRMDVDPSGVDLQVVLSGCDAFAIEVAWWRAHRRRFRPYILGEACWDNVYAAVLMCHGGGWIVNRAAAIRHDAHATAWGGGAFAEYNGYLASLDARYFTLWATYYDQVVQARARGATEAEERELASRVFVWRRSPVRALRQAARDLRAHVRYRQQRARWPSAGSGAAAG